MPPLGNQITDRNNLNVQVPLEAKGRPKTAYAITDDSDSRLYIKKTKNALYFRPTRIQ